jgi:DNA repair protein RecN (Recombination protein N)
MALKRIVLRDFVIIDELDLEFAPGFTVLTGETGAGKSILIDALQLVTGARADTGLIREGASRTDVSVEFDQCQLYNSWLEAAGFDTGFDPGATLLLRRTVDAQGKSRAWINGSPATAAQLRELGEQLFDIHGQHAWQSLTRADAVRGLLDAYGRVDTEALSSAWTHWRQTVKTLEDARAAQDRLQSERERLSWQIGEVEKLDPQPGEWETLNTDHGRLAHAQALLDAAQGALDALEGEEGGARQALDAARTSLQNQEHLEPEFKALGEVLESSLAQVADSVHTLRAYLRRTDLDPERLAELDARLTQWMTLARRYKRTPEELPAALASWREELARLDAAADLEALQNAEQEARAAYLQAARAVSQARAAAAPQLAQAITQAMQGLGMEGGRFDVALQTTEQPQAHGLEDVQFLVAGHAGSTPRPIGKVASGGELSRIALAIAVTTSQLGTAQTLIFDEVDSGVGGAVAETVGRLMQRLGQDRQVLAVTHLPQVASCADNHLQVAKQREGSATLSSVTQVQGEARVQEIARMLGGERLTGATLAHAKEMLQDQGQPGLI